MLVEKLERQARRYRDKRRPRAGARASGAVEAEPTPTFQDEEGPVIVKTKQFAVKPMTVEEAVLQLELIGHDFFVFQNAESSDINVVYRRRDGDYGLIEPQVG
jgi:putative sigma-54 modulation protein